MPYSLHTFWPSASSLTRYTMPLHYGNRPAPPKAETETSLEWLDRAVEETCALARVS